jgi:hypothetical protein
VRKSALDEEKDRLAQVEAENAALQREKASLASAEQTEIEIETLQGQVEQLLATDISWARMLQEIARTIPNDTWLTAFQGTSTTGDPTAGGTAGGTTTPGTTPSTSPSGTTPTTSTAGGVTDSSTTSTTAVGAVPGAPSPSEAAAGTVSFTIVGLDFPSVSAWIQRIGSQIPSFTNLWVPSATRGGSTAGAGSTSGSSSSSGSGREFVNFTSTAAITSAARSDRLERVQRSRG